MARTRCPLHSRARKKSRRAGDTVTMMARIEIDRPTTGASKLLGLELIRFACAMMVLIFHYKHFAMIGGGAISPDILPFAVPLSLIYGFGDYGVQIFWCISGFILYWKYADAFAARRVEPKRFFWLRFSRLYPLHIATLLIVAGLQPFYVALAGKPFIYDNNGAASFMLQLFLADQWAASRELSFNGPIWSVSAEVLVYIAFFLLLRLFGKSPWLIAAAVGASLWSIWSGSISPALVCGGYFFAGGGAALWLGSNRSRARPAEARRIALTMIGACITATLWLDMGGNGGDTAATWLMAVTPPLLFLAARDMPSLERWQAPIQAAGNLTYSTYLIHFPLQLAVAIGALASGISLPVGEPWFLIAYLAATLIIGRIVFVKFEAPAQQWIRSAALSPKTAGSPRVPKAAPRRVGVEVP